MIIEFFGAPGSGKTTIARALAQRLQERGYRAELVLSYRPGEDKLRFDSSGLIHGMKRMLRAAVDIAVILRRPRVHANHVLAVVRLIKDLPPKNIFWFLRCSQYIFRMAILWHAASEQKKITIFDQAFAQAVCSLAIFNRSAETEKIRRALEFVPKANVLVGVDASAAVLEQRLRDRRKTQSPVERLLEADIETNLKFRPLAGEAAELFRTCRRPFVFLRTDKACLEQNLEVIELKVIDALRAQTQQSQSEAAAASTPAIALAATAANIEFSDLSLVAQKSSADGPRARSTAEVVHQLSWATLSSFSVYVGGAGLTSAAQFVIARLAHASSYGVYSYVAAYVTLLSYAATLGFTALVLRYASAYAAKGEWELSRGVVWFAIKGAGLAAVALAAGGLLLVGFWWHDMKPEIALTAVFGLLAVPLVTLQLIGASIVRVFGGVFSALFPERILRDGLLLLFVVSVFFSVAQNVDATTIMFGFLLSSAAALALIVYAAIRREPDEIRRAKTAFQAAEWWKFSVPIMVMMAMEIVVTRSAVILLGWSGRIEEAGAFALCFNVAMLVQLPRAAVGTYFAPAASELWVRHEHGRLQALYTRAAFLSLAGAAAIALPVLLATGHLLRLFGPDFAIAAPVAQVLVLGQVFAAAAGPQQNLLMMTGQERPAAIIMTGFAVLNIVLCAIVITYYGAIGAAAITACVVVAWNIAMALFIWAKLGLIVGPGLHKLERRQGRNGAAVSANAAAFVHAEPYQDSHQGRAAAAAYVRTYQTGYYAALWKSVERPLLEETLCELGGAQRSCLDFACGTGRIASVACRHFGKVVSVDISQSMLQYAPKHRNVQYLCSDIIRDPLEHSFDVATAFRFFLNAEPELREAALRALHRHLVRGGRLVCNVHMNSSSPMGIVYRLWAKTSKRQHHKTLSVAEFLRVLHAHGFATEQVKFYGYCPRPGPFLPHLCELAVGPVERVCRALNIPSVIAQNFMIVARKS